MHWAEIETFFNESWQLLSAQAQRIPGSAIALRYVRSSYQNDPIRSAIELILFLFAVRYLLAPKYSAQKHKGFVDLNEDVRSYPPYRLLTDCLLPIQEIDELVDDWAPEPLVAAPSAFEARDLEQRPTIVGYGEAT